MPHILGNNGAVEILRPMGKHARRFGLIKSGRNWINLLGLSVVCGLIGIGNGLSLTVFAKDPPIAQWKRFGSIGAFLGNGGDTVRIGITQAGIWCPLLAIYLYWTSATWHPLLVSLLDGKVNQANLHRLFVSISRLFSIVMPAPFALALAFHFMPLHFISCPPHLRH